ncbi:MAG: PEGA domain-containing protein [Sandaracinaceae bacterium]|nr:PEGA domain-containing protein [Sandaracinaceae bacterium]
MGRTTAVLLVASGEGASESSGLRAVRARIEERDDLEPASLSRLAALATETRESATEDVEAEVRARLAGAEDAFSRFDYTGATTQLDEALVLLRPLARTADGRARLARTHLTLAMVLMVHGEREAAVEELRTCRHLDADCAPDPARHPPELAELFREVAASDGGEGALSVATEPPDATATLDGRREAPTPARWDAVSPGRHYVTLARDGFVPDVQVVNVGGGTPTERQFALTLGPPPARAAAALRALEADGVLAEARWRAEAAALTEADVLVVLSRSEERLALAAFDGRGAPIGETLRLALDDAGAFRRHLDTVLPPTTVPFYGQWWFWTPVALGVAVILVAITFAIFNVPDVRVQGGDVIPL